MNPFESKPRPILVLYRTNRHYRHHCIQDTHVQESVRRWALSSDRVVGRTRESLDHLPKRLCYIIAQPSFPHLTVWRLAQGDRSRYKRVHWRGRSRQILPAGLPLLPLRLRL